MHNKTKAVERYFENQYPLRPEGVSDARFRFAEETRLDVLKSLLSQHKVESICDVGCGDGFALGKLLEVAREIKYVHLIDISPKFISLAERHIGKKGLRVTVENKSLFDCDNRVFDMVIAIGVSDYYKNWQEFLSALILRTKNILIVDFPKISLFRHSLRRIWLGFHGLPLHTTSRRRLEILLDQYDLRYQILDSKYNYIVKLDIGGAPIGHHAKN